MDNSRTFEQVEYIKVSLNLNFDDKFIKFVKYISFVFNNNNRERERGRVERERERNIIYVQIFFNLMIF